MATVDKVRDLMEDTFGSTFKEYYTGDPDVIPIFNLPCLIITQLGDDTTEAQQGEDEVTDRVQIKVVLNKADDYTGQIDPVNLTDKKVRDLVGQAEPNGRYPVKSIKGALRNELLANDYEAVAPTMSVEYGITPRETLGDTDNVAWTSEGHVTFSLTYPVYTY